MNVVILAAGMGKRMQSALPKVLHPLAGKPLLSHVIDSARALAPSRLCVIYGHGGEAVPVSMAAPDVRFAKQEPQLGTGHAVLQALPHLDDSASTLVLYGDVPLTTAATLQRLLAAAGDDKLAILTVELDDSGRLRPHRARERHDPPHRRAKGCQRRRARDPRNQYRHPGGADREAEALAGDAVERQRPARVLPDRHRRPRSGRWRAGGFSAAGRGLGNAWASTARCSWPSWNASTSATLPTRCWNKVSRYWTRLASTYAAR